MSAQKKAAVASTFAKIRSDRMPVPVTMGTLFMKTDMIAKREDANMKLQLQWEKYLVQIIRIIIRAEKIVFGNLQRHLGTE